LFAQALLIFLQSALFEKINNTFGLINDFLDKDETIFLRKLGLVKINDKKRHNHVFYQIMQTTQKVQTLNKKIVSSLSNLPKIIKNILNKYAG